MVILWFLLLRRLNHNNVVIIICANTNCKSLVVLSFSTPHFYFLHFSTRVQKLGQILLRATPPRGFFFLLALRIAVSWRIYKNLNKFGNLSSLRRSVFVTVALVFAVIVSSTLWFDTLIKLRYKEKILPKLSHIINVLQLHDLFEQQIKTLETKIARVFLTGCSTSLCLHFICVLFFGKLFSSFTVYHKTSRHS